MQCPCRLALIGFMSTARVTSPTCRCRLKGFDNCSSTVLLSSQTLEDSAKERGLICCVAVTERLRDTPAAMHDPPLVVCGILSASATLHSQHLFALCQNSFSGRLSTLRNLPAGRSCLPSNGSVVLGECRADGCLTGILELF